MNSHFVTTSSHRRLGLDRFATADEIHDAVLLSDCLSIDVAETYEQDLADAIYEYARACDANDPFVTSADLALLERMSVVPN